jgi:hypothetical protein
VETAASRCPASRQLIYAANGQLSVQIVLTSREALLGVTARLHFIFRSLGTGSGRGLYYSLSGWQSQRGTCRPSGEALLLVRRKWAPCALGPPAPGRDPPRREHRLRLGTAPVTPAVRRRGCCRDGIRRSALALMSEKHACDRICRSIWPCSWQLVEASAPLHWTGK